MNLFVNYYVILENMSFFPIRCFSCNKPIAQYEQKYIIMTEQQCTSKKDALDKLNIKRYCCRRMFLGHVNISEQILMFSEKKS